MHSDKYSERLISLTIHILKRHNPKTIQTLKNVLTYLPSPAHGKQILATAIVQLSETCPETVYWLLQHPESLQPELNVIEVITCHLSNQLSEWGLERDRDFHFTVKGQLVISQSGRKILLSHHSIRNLSDDGTRMRTVLQTLLTNYSNPK